MDSNKPVTPEMLRQAILQVLDYSWHDEQQDFLQSSPTERINHICLALRLLTRWLHQSSETSHE